MYIKKLLMISITLMALPLVSNAQVNATTDDGREVILYDNGTWEYADDKEGLDKRGEKGRTTQVYIGNERFEAGRAKEIIEENLYNLKLQVVKKGERALLVLWSESGGGCVPSDHRFGRPSGYHDTNMRIFLSDGSAIKFIDRDNKGQRTISDAYEDDNTDDILASNDMCRQWIIYRITKDEEDKIKGEKVESLKIDFPSMQGGSKVFRIRKNQSTLSKQLRSLGF